MTPSPEGARESAAGSPDATTSDGWTSGPLSAESVDEAYSIDLLQPGQRWPRQVSTELPNVLLSAVPGIEIARKAVPIALVVLLLGLGAGLIGAALTQINVTVDGHGYIEPLKLWTVRASAAGAIKTVLVSAGDTVVLGQPLVALDSSARSLAIAEDAARLSGQEAELRRLAVAAPIERQEREASVRLSAARLAKARAQLQQRMGDLGLFGSVDSLLVSHKVGAHAMLDAAIADVTQASADLESATTAIQRTMLTEPEEARASAQLNLLRAQLDHDRDRLSRHVLRAPARGIIVTDHPELLPGTVVQEGTTVLEVADVGSWRAMLQVTERDVHRVRVGDRVLLQMPALAVVSSEPVTGVVTHVAMAQSGAGPGSSPDGAGSTLVVPSGLFRVDAAIDARSVAAHGIETLRRGFSVNAKIVTRRTSALQALQDWLVSRPAQ